MHRLGELQKLYGDYLSANPFRGEPDTLYGPVNYVMGLGGKRLRPILTLMAGDLFGIPPQNLLCVAHSVEIFHNFTLVHDDIMDEAPLRRNKPTVHTKYGLPTGILSGDVMLILAYESLLQFGDSNQIPALVRLFNRVAREVCEGQEMDMVFEKMANLDLMQYERMIALKTAALLGGALELGAVAAAAPASDAANLARFGIHTGIAFQIQDDYLDTFGEAAQVGKQIGGDIIQNKMTFLVLSALEQAAPNQAERLRLLMRKNPSLPSVEKINEVTALFRELEVPLAATRRKDFHASIAMEALDAVDVPSSRKENLTLLAQDLLGRNH